MWRPVMVTKQQFYDHMHDLYGTDIEDNLYKTFKKIVKIKNKGAIKELRELVSMDKKHRLAYRFALAANGKEYTPRQIDQYLSMIQYALEHISTDEE
jgi:hypothetical protein